jgi:N-acetyl-alpha-D-muramate 1-phosphate uridylyltransferase
MKAMILAAGRGERLRPLTDTLPKPLIVVRGQPLIVRHVERLAAAGFRDIVINVSHLGALITDALGNGERWGVTIGWSREPAPLETAGGIATARELLGTAPFLLVNADIYCDYAFAGSDDFDLRGRLGHIVMVPNPPFRPAGDFSLERGLVGNQASPRYTYSGIAVLDPLIVDGIAPGSKAPLAPLLRSAAESGRLGGELYAGLWNDVGTPERLAELNEMK